jgi:thioredoxin reductase
LVSSGAYSDGISQEIARVLPTSGVFIYIGHKPNTELFRDQLEMDPHGYLVTDKWLHTNVDGVFAAGEVTDPRFRQSLRRVWAPQRPWKLKSISPNTPNHWP